MGLVVVSALLPTFSVPMAVTLYLPDGAASLSGENRPVAITATPYVAGSVWPGRDGC